MKGLNDFVALFAEQFEETDPSEISASTEFHDLDEWSSLTAMSVIAMAKTELGKSITGKEIRCCKTVEDLYRIVINK